MNSFINIFPQPKVGIFFTTSHLASLSDSRPSFPILVGGQASLAEPEGV